MASADDLLSSGDVEGAALAAGLSADDLQKLKAAANSPQDLAAAVGGYIHLDANQQAAVSALGSKNYAGALKNISAELGIAGTSQLIDGGQSLLSGDLMGAVGPLVAGALAATGVGAPVVAAVGGAIALGESALQALGVGQGPSGCGWRVGNTCFNGARPYGPDDPQWRPLARVADAHQDDWPWPMNGIDPYYQTVLSEVQALEGRRSAFQSSPVSTDSRLDGFRLAFDRAYLAQLEKAVNGHPVADPLAILHTVAYAWNEKHKGPSVTINGDNAPRTSPVFNEEGSTFSPQPKSPIAGLYKETFLEMILRGQVDGNRQAPLSINTGSESVVLSIPKGGWVLGLVGPAKPKTLPVKVPNFGGLTPAQLGALKGSQNAAGAKPATGLDAPLIQSGSGKVILTKRGGLLGGAFAAAIAIARHFL